MFVLHMLSSDQPFLPRDLFRDRNLMLGLIFTAVTGLLMIVTATLLPPFLQQLKGYPVFTTGIVHGAARHRHDDLDVHGVAPDRQGRRALADRDRARPVRPSRSTT